MTGIALLAALAALAAPAKDAFGSAVKPEVNAEFLPRSARVEIDGEVRGTGFVKLEVPDPKRTLRVRVSAEGFVTEEATIEAGRVADREYMIALRPAGFERRLSAKDASGLALAAAALWRAGRGDDAADYAEQSLRAGDTALAHRVLGDVWRRRGDRDQATREYTRYLSLSEHPPDEAEIRAWLLQPRPGDIEIPAK